MMFDRLIVFSRYPEPGQCKKRMIPALGPEGAARLHREMASATLQVAERIADSLAVEVRVRFTGADAISMAGCFGTQFVYEDQGAGDLGQRLERAVRESFQTGLCRVIVVGTDCPDLSADILHRAFDRLRDHDLVIGPASDGGYYLLGLSRHAESLFSGIAWGTSDVLMQTLKTALEFNLSVSLLPTLDDVDRPEDLGIWERTRHVDSQRAKGPERSVIIPTLNEEPLLEQTVLSTGSSTTERIIVATGRVDESLRVAVKQRCQFLMCAPGRARQMNAGARNSLAPTLLFLHADSRLPDGYETAVESELARDGTVAGAFCLAIAAPGWKYRCVERAIAWRSRWRQRPYGDQAIYLRREIFDRLRGFSELPLLEDFDFAVRLRKLGRIGLSRLRVTTSARRWQTLGVIRTTLINLCIIVGYRLGISCDRLARWYRRRRIPGK